MANWLSVPCPECRAKTGEYCINTSSGLRFTGFAHRGRRADAIEAEYERVTSLGGDDGV